MKNVVITVSPNKVIPTGYKVITTTSNGMSIAVSEGCMNG